MYTTKRKEAEEEKNAQSIAVFQTQHHCMYNTMLRLTLHCISEEKFCMNFDSNCDYAYWIAFGTFLCMERSAWKLLKPICYYRKHYIGDRSGIKCTARTRTINLVESYYNQVGKMQNPCYDILNLESFNIATNGNGCGK